MNRLTGYIVALSVVFCGVQSVRADLSYFGDRSSFLNAAPSNLMSEGFNSRFPGSAPEVWFPINGPQIFQVAENSVSRHVVSTFTVNSPELYISEGAGAVRFSVNPSTFDFMFNAPINAFGIDITDIDPGFNITFSDDLGNSYNMTDIAAQAGHSPYNQFFGVVNSDPFNTVTFDVTRTTGGFNSTTGKGFLGFDLVQFGLANVAAVPEPAALATWLVPLTALVGCWLLRRKRGPVPQSRPTR